MHGNGPQVGNLAIQQERGRDEVPEMPLFSLGAMTEGQLGSLIAIALYRACGGRHHIVAMLSHVIVDVDDPAFDHPTKPIGPFFSEAQARLLARARVGHRRGRGPRLPPGGGVTPADGDSSRSTRSAACSMRARSW